MSGLGDRQTRGYLLEHPELLAEMADRYQAQQAEERLAAVADAGALPKDFDRMLEESLDTGMFENGETKKARFKAARERSEKSTGTRIVRNLREGVRFNPACGLEVAG